MCWFWKEFDRVFFFGGDSYCPNCERFGKNLKSTMFMVKYHDCTISLSFFSSNVFLGRQICQLVKDMSSLLKVLKKMASWWKITRSFSSWCKISYNFIFLIYVLQSLASCPVLRQSCASACQTSLMMKAPLILRRISELCTYISQNWI